MAKKHIKQVQDLAAGIAGSDAAAHAVVERFRDTCQRLSSDERAVFFSWLANDLEVGRSALDEPIKRLLDTPDDDSERWGRNMLGLRQAIASPRRRVLGSLINIPGGMKFILELRAEILELQRAGRQGLEPVEEEIAGLLNDWCTHGFMFLEEVDSTSPFEKIRFLKERELVHPMLSLEEMGRRLGEDRLCFALCHVVMPDEPVVFIEVALSRGLVRSILSRSGWHSDPVFIRHLQKPLREIAHIYLAGERDRRGRPLNPVANFHLGNGATLAERNVNFGANTSPRGIDESCGLMVNYLYSRTTFQQLGSTVRSLLPWSRRGL